MTRFHKKKLGNSLKVTVGICVALSIILSGCGCGSRGNDLAGVFKVIDDGVKDNDWSDDGSFIAYSKVAEDGYFDVWVIDPSGSGRRCLTQSARFTRRNRGSVSWHPSGSHIAYTCQNEDALGRLADIYSAPGIGLNCNIWVMTEDGGKAWRLTDMPTSMDSPRGVIHPQFSRDGGKLLWAEACGDNSRQTEYDWGIWRLGVGDFVVENGVPSLENVVYFQPGEQKSFYESHDWRGDGSAVLFSGNLQRGQPVNGIDIYMFEPGSGALARLTDTFNDWDEHAHFSPDGSKIAWMSGAGLHVSFPSVSGLSWRKYVKTELWIMGSDGSGKRRLTFFNEEENPQHDWLVSRVGRTQRAVVSDSSFDPGGGRLVMTVAYVSPRSPQAVGGSLLVVADLDRL